MEEEATKYIRLIELATQAPSGHNTQPWIFTIQENQITIEPDLSRTLPVVDGNHRELYISLGCAAENLCIAASAAGYQTKVGITTRNDTERVIQITLHKATDVQPSPLFPFIGKRQMNRQTYNGNKILDLFLDKLETVQTEADTQFYFFENDSPQFEALRPYILEGNKRQMNDQAFKEELKSWMRFNKKHSEATHDGLSYAVFGAPDLPAFISKTIMSSVLNSRIQNKGDNKKINSSSHFVLFTTRNNSIENWITSGRTLQRFLLTASKEGIACAFFNQPCEVKELADKIQETFPINKEYPILLLRLGYAKAAPYSSRRNVTDVIRNG